MEAEGVINIAIRVLIPGYRFVDVRACDHESMDLKI
jgi:hypothetical protein